MRNGDRFIATTLRFSEDVYAWLKMEAVRQRTSLAALIEDRFRDAPLGEDTNMRRLWLGIEDFLVTRFPEATRITTPFDDPAFETAAYRAFLGSLGYAPVAEAAYGKALSPRV